MKTRGLPDFLVIGAMKCGTTTLYADLAAQPTICMSTIKEPSVLIRQSDPAKAAAAYRRLFEVRPGHQRFGEASTLYSQLPRHPGVPERARELCGPDLRLIYLVRNPVERALSHHYHEYTLGNCGPDVDAVLRSDATAVDFGRYALQLEAWHRVFGEGSVLVLRFEDYVRARAATIEKVGAFLDVAVEPGRIEADKAFNQGEEGRRMPRALRPLFTSDLWRLWIRRAIPGGLRARVRDLVAPPSKLPPRPPPPRADTLDYLIDKLRPDAERLAAMVGWPTPIWDFEATRRKYVEQSTQ
jgi:hypothetical protein